MDLRVVGDISLSIKRAKLSSNNCFHPQCLEQANLRRISFETRYNLMKKLRFYVASKCVGCDVQRNISSWRAADVNESDYPFTREQIEDMVDLLRFEPKRLNFVLPG